LIGAAGGSELPLLEEGVDDPKPNTEEIPSQLRPPDFLGPFDVAAIDEIEEADEGVGTSPVEVAVFGVEGSF